MDETVRIHGQPATSAGCAGLEDADTVGMVETGMLRALPKISLHDHLDGGVRPATLLELAAARGMRVDTGAGAGGRAGSLREYLRRFEAPIGVLQDAATLRRVAREALEDLRADGVIHAELRFAPVLHTREGLRIEEAIEAVREELARSQMSTTLLICLLRGDERNGKVIEAGVRTGMVDGFDIAGDERRWSLRLHERELSNCVEMGFPLTVHAGEAGGYREVLEAVELGASRIGHGVALANALVHGHRDALEKVRDAGVCLEVCVTSNLDTGAVIDPSRHPIALLREAGVEVTVNTDNRSVSRTSMTAELELVRDRLGWGVAELLETQRAAVRHAYVTESRRQELHALLDTAWKGLAERELISRSA